MPAAWGVAIALALVLPGCGASAPSPAPPGVAWGKADNAAAQPLSLELQPPWLPTQVITTVHCAGGCDLWVEVAAHATLTCNPQQAGCAVSPHAVLILTASRDDPGNTGGLFQLPLAANGRGFHHARGIWADRVALQIAPSIASQAQPHLQNIAGIRVTMSVTGGGAPVAVVAPPPPAPVSTRRSCFGHGTSCQLPNEPGECWDGVCVPVCAEAGAPCRNGAAANCNDWQCQCSDGTTHRANGLCQEGYCDTVGADCECENGTVTSAMPLPCSE